MVTLPRLTADELLRHAYNEHDPLTSTALEAEMLRSLEDLTSAAAENEPLLKMLDDRGLGAPAALEAQLDKAAAVDERIKGIALLDLLLDLLLEFDIDDPATLKKALERNVKFESVLNDLAQPLASLQALVTKE